MNTRDKDSVTPLVKAVLNDHTDVVRELLKSKNVDVNCRFGVSALTPLMLAIGNTDIVQQLVTARANLYIRPCLQGYDGPTALGYAAQEGHDESIRLLLEAQDQDPDTCEGDHNIFMSLLIASPGKRVLFASLAGKRLNRLGGQSFDVLKKMCVTISFKKHVRELMAQIPNELTATGLAQDATRAELGFDIPQEWFTEISNDHTPAIAGSADA